MTGPNRVLLTGAGGFIGRRIADELRSLGAEVVDARTATQGGDLLVPEVRARAISEARAEVLVHAAWVTAHGAFWNSPLNLEWEEASQDLFARFAAAGGRRIVGLGSVAEYDWTTGAERFGEDAPLAPATIYGSAKARTGGALGNLASAEGLSHLWARIFFTFGQGEPRSRLIPALINAFQSGTPIDTGPAELTRDFLDADVLGTAIARLALGDVEGPMNVASGDPSRLDEIADVIAAALDRPVSARFGGRALAPNEPLRLVADTRRLASTGIETAGLLRSRLSAYARAFGTSLHQRSGTG
ncbi:NAD-dependent epimerase/dehydratase family protein [Limibaculum sp. M0105]|uniref:NAD-dependent epimerase/dehydratase family protein n=1 Tax=Thermohalobaculum xanthum TaxID=2753746 RepID=A0A8J7M7Q7_9RHOB|nr:NAD(P)-dependent oxidoreductase [Thermohalobaculum xanthum]MBK0399213.1 NAD-dependent epimerase/dehydratase family protein [Thermohalobaculum xanthum]